MDIKEIRVLVVEAIQKAKVLGDAKLCWEKTADAILEALQGRGHLSHDHLWIAHEEFEIHRKAVLPSFGRRELPESRSEFELISAPQWVADIPVTDDWFVRILQYKACQGEWLVPMQDCQCAPTLPFFRFREEMRFLDRRRTPHPYARSLLHLKISSEKGLLVIDGWGGLDEQTPRRSEDDLHRLDRGLTIATQGRTVAYQGPREHYAPSRHGIRRMFGHAPVLLPVVHPVDHETALASIKVCVEEGVDGIFLINQGMDDEDVLALVLEVRRKYPALWVGLNLLGSSPSQALTTALAALEGSVDGLWVDNALVDERNESQDKANQFVATRHDTAWNGLFFGGVAFKYQREVAGEKLAEVAALAVPLMDVVCTSGPGTGMAAEVDKVKAMREGMGPFASLALASGVTIDNVKGYLPYVDAFLVGTGIESDFGVIDRERVRQLNRIIDAHALALPPVPSLELSLDPIDEQTFKPIYSDIHSVLTDTAIRLEDAHILYSRALKMGATGRALRRLRDSVHVSLRRALSDLAILIGRRYQTDANDKIAAISLIATRTEEFLSHPNTDKTSSIRSLINSLSPN